MKKIIMMIFIIFIVAFIYFDLNQNKILFHEVKFYLDKDKYIEVSNEEEFIKAIENNNIKIININNDLDLGYNSLIKKSISSKFIIEHNKALTHPILRDTGVSKLLIKNSS